MYASVTTDILTSLVWIRVNRTGFYGRDFRCLGFLQNASDGTFPNPIPDPAMQDLERGDALADIAANELRLAASARLPLVLTRTMPASWQRRLRQTCMYSL